MATALVRTEFPLQKRSHYGTLELPMRAESLDNESFSTPCYTSAHQPAVSLHKPFPDGAGPVTAGQFRKLALSLPEAVEAEHMGHPDFRVGGKIFATLGPDEKWGMVKLQPDQQASLMASEPNVFQPASGAWGKNGSTIVRL